MKADGKVVGSVLIGQSYDLPQKKGERDRGPDPKWFQPRPSNGWAANSVNTQYELDRLRRLQPGGDNTDLIKAVKDAQGSGRQGQLDGGHPSPDGPRRRRHLLRLRPRPGHLPGVRQIQIHRVAEENGLPVDQVEKLVEDHTDGRTLGFLGEPRVNVLELNIALKELVRSAGEG